MNRMLRKCTSVILSTAFAVTALAGTTQMCLTQAQAADDTITLRVCNWEEYIDEGSWDETIDLESGDIKGENPIVKDFEDVLQNLW